MPYSMKQHEQQLEKDSLPDLKSMALLDYNIN